MKPVLTFAFEGCDAIELAIACRNGTAHIENTEVITHVNWAEAARAVAFILV